MKSVLILMAVYNGQTFLREQLDSLISQTYPNISILIRDDESSDLTIEIIEEYQQNYKNIRLICGENIGVSNSFLELIKMAEDTDYYAFCDQDDYWLPDKIANAVEAFSSKETSDSQSIYYCCGYEIVDENLQSIGKRSTVLSESDHSFGNALVDTLSIGCSVVINNQLFKVLKDKLPPYCYIHDQWIYLVAETVNSVLICDSRIGIKYRKHADNVTFKSSFPIRLAAAFKRVFDMQTKHRTSRQALALKELFYDKLNAEYRRNLDNIIDSNSSIKVALNLLLNKNIRKKDKLGQLGLKLRILFRLL